jgi:transposase InsO family protein
MARYRTTELTLAALSYALKGRRFGRGIEYTAHRFKAALQKVGFVQSFNRPGVCTDNAHVESFFHTMKAELISGRKFQIE